jgi:arginine/lysine/ornithine decarboxylase
MYLYEELIRYGASDAYPFHMPGHKRRLGSLPDPYSFDITEIDGFDNLHHAEGVILEAERRAAQLYGSGETHFLVNGSTCGILAAISACCRRGSGRILMSRGSHKSAYHAAGLNGLETVYLYPRADGELNGPVRAEDVKRALEENRRRSGARISAVFVTSPSYEGIVSDIGAIAETVHAFGLPLIVDEAHGAHFGMHDLFPESSVKLGADIVIHSLHKTLPSLTQTALLHVNGDLADRRRLRLMLDTFQSSSPSYVLMAGMDECIGMLREHGRELFDRYAEALLAFYAEWGIIPGQIKRKAGTAERVRILDHFELLVTDDPSRILICPAETDMTASDLYDILREEYHLQSEMLSLSYVLMLSSVGDDEEGFRRLSRALREIDRLISERENGSLRAECTAGPAKEGRCEPAPGMGSQEREVTPADTGRMDMALTLPRAEVCMRISEAEDAVLCRLPLERSAGRISGEYLYLYPPGVPLLVPGERIGEELLKTAEKLKTRGCSLQGLSDYSAGTILTVS